MQGDGLLFLVVVGSYVFSRLAISEKVVRTGQCGERRARTREDEREARGELKKKKKKNKLNRYRQQSVDLMKKTNFLQKTKRTVNVDGYEPRRARKNPAPTGKKRRPWHQCAAEDAAPGPHGRQALGRKGVSGPTRRAARGTVYAC